MAYAQNNLSHVSPTLVSGAWSMFVYRSADPFATVIAAGYIANAAEMGMSVDDTVLIVDTNLHLQNWYKVSAIAAGGGATLVVIP